MTLTQLSYVIALDTHQHFRKAAEHVFVTQPTLSMQVQKLEEELGVVLFDRSKHPIAPTALGKAVIAQARIVLGEVERIRALTEAATQEVAGTLRVGVIPTLAPYLLPLLIEPFTARYPDVTMVFEELLAEHIVARIREDTLDVGLVATETLAPGMQEQIVFEEPFVAYVAAEHRLAALERLRIKDIRPGDVWLLSEGHCFRQQAEELCPRRRPDMQMHRQVQFESGNLETLKRLVEQSRGMTLLPALAVSQVTADKKELIKHFVAPEPKRTVRLIASSAYPKRRLLEAFQAQITAVAESALLDLELHEIDL